MKSPHFFGEICAQRYANQRICHAVSSATRVKQGVGLCVLQQPLASGVWHLSLNIRLQGYGRRTRGLTLFLLAKPQSVPCC
jgi:hypothetical protein